MQKLDKIKNVKFQSLAPGFLPGYVIPLSRGKNMDSGAMNANMRRRMRRSLPAIFRRERVDVVVVTPESRLHPEALTSVSSSDASETDPSFSQALSASSRWARRSALAFASLPSAFLASEDRDSGRTKMTKRTKMVFNVAAT